MKKTVAIVLAAGQGKRMNSTIAKQFLILQDKPIIYYSLKAFEDSVVDEIILVTSKEHIEYCNNLVENEFQLKKISKVVEGGAERYDSVFQAINSIREAEYVLIHDGARPLITTAKINEVVHQVEIHGACLVGIPVKDTIKIVDENGFIKNTPNRETMWSAQTPQAFAYDMIRKAYEMFFEEEDNKRKSFTDDAMIYEIYLKRQIKMISGDYSNIKITTEEDIKLAETLM